MKAGLLRDVWVCRLNTFKRLTIQGGTCQGAICQPVVLTAVQDEFSGLAVDDSYVYWTTLYGSVARVAKGGGTPEALASDDHITGIAVDETHVYWLNDSYGGVFKVSKAGGAAEMISGVNEVPAMGMALNEAHAYWSSYNKSSLRESRKADSNPRASLLTRIRRPAWLLTRRTSTTGCRARRKR